MDMKYPFTIGLTVPSHLMLKYFTTLFLFPIYLCNLYSQHEASPHDPEIKSFTLFQMSQPGAPYSSSISNSSRSQWIVKSQGSKGGRETIMVSTAPLCNQFFKKIPEWIIIWKPALKNDLLLICSPLSHLGKSTKIKNKLPHFFVFFNDLYMA